MLRRWVDHYGRHVGVEHLLVFDDNSSDGSTADLPCTVHHMPTMPGGEQFEHARMQVVNGIALGLLAVYDAVIFTDVDEFLIPDPDQYPTLIDFLAARPERDVLAPLGLNVLHHVHVEPDLVPDQPILGQRRFAKFVPLMCKPSIKRVPANWVGASHGIKSPFSVDRDLFMFHMKFADRSTLRTMSERRNDMVKADGRASKTSWNRSADSVVGMLEEFVGDADPATVPEFDPAAVDLSKIVEDQGNGRFRPAKIGQLTWMRNQPLVRIPERLLGLV